MSTPNDIETRRTLGEVAPLKLGENRSARLVMRLRPDELERIERRAEREHLPVSTYARSALLREVESS